MKKSILTILSAATLVLGVSQSQAQTTVTTDSTQTWIGYMNVFGINSDQTPNYGAYQFGSGWGTADLRAFFIGTNCAVLTPNINCYNPADAYWVNSDGTPNKWMDASFYVQNDALAGQTITFTGKVLTNTLTGAASSVAFIKDFAPDYSYSTPVTANLVAGQTFTITLTTSAGHHIQYGYETQAPVTSPTNTTAGSVAIAVNTADPTIAGPNNLSLVEGQNAVFTVTPKGTYPFSYQWQQITSTATNILTDGGRISGATTGTLTISGVTLADAGSYYVTVSNTHGTAAAPGLLSVTPLAQVQTNLLVDPGFENGSFVSTPITGWVNFNGAAEQNVDDYYYGSITPISVYQGTNTVQIYAYGPGSYSGFYQDTAVVPGHVYTANGEFLTSAWDPISGQNSCYLEVQFRDASDNVLVDYRSASVTASFPQDTWINLSATNEYANDFVTVLGHPQYLVAPANAAKVRTQVTYATDSNNSGGSVYVDMLDLKLQEPVVKAAISGANVQLSFPTIYGVKYNVLYKAKLTDASWSVLTTVTGDGTVKAVSDSKSAAARLYIVNTQ